MTDDRKKQRKINWSSDELQTLVELCSCSQVIGAKLSSTVTFVDKNKFWEECTERVNSVGCVNRTKEEVKKKWTDVKSSTKRKAQMFRKESRQTGGGPAPAPLKDWEEKVVSFLPVSVIDGILDGGDLFQDTVDNDNSTSLNNHCATNNQENNEEPIIITMLEERNNCHSPNKKRKHTDIDDYSKRILDQGEEKLSLKKQELIIKKAQTDILLQMLEEQKTTNNLLIRILETSPKPIQCVSPVIKFRL